jgi:hypothetical protein
MIRALTIVIFLVTPIAAVAGWLLGNPLVGLLLLVLIPLLGVGFVVQKLRRDPDATAALLTRRDEISGPDRG